MPGICMDCIQFDDDDDYDKSKNRIHLYAKGGGGGEVARPARLFC